MNSVVRIVAVVVGIGCFAGASYIAYAKVYAEPVAELRERIAEDADVVERLERQRGRRASVRERVRGVVETTLAGDEARVQHEFRTGLAASADAAALGDVEVSTGAASGVESPIASNRAVRRLRKPFSDGDDFSVIRGEVRGVGSIERVVDAIAIAGSQPWVHRIEGVQVRAVGKSGERFSVRLDVATLFFRGEAGLQEVVLSEPGDGVRAAASQIVASGAFGVKDAAPVVAVERAPEAPKPVPAAPPARWRVAAVVTADGRDEVWCVRVDAAGRSVLTVGQAVAGFELVGTDGEAAVFRAGERRFQVMPGQVIAP